MQKREPISATVPDWTREQVRSFWDPGPKLIRCIRRYQTARSRGGVLGWASGKYWALCHRFWSTITQSEIHLHMPIGGGLSLPHPTGIIINQESTIGPNCLIFHQVTLAGEVRIGGRVDIGAGAKLLGPIEIGDHAQIGANAVVTKNVAPYEIVAGIPAKVIGSTAPDAS